VTAAEKRLCDAAERFWHWGRRPATAGTSAKFDYWKSRMQSAAHVVYRERQAVKKARKP
jgi:hypothetical protein